MRFGPRSSDSQVERGEIVKTPPKVAIVCPAHNASDFLERAINSVLVQSVTDWELIIVDDGSTDGTLEIARRYSQMDSRIQVIQLGVKRGVAHARNIGLGRAAGRWLAFLDADDFWLPSRLEKGLNFAESQRASFVYTSYRFISHDERYMSASQRVPAKVSYSKLLQSNVIATSTVLIDRATTGDFEMREHASEDFICWLEILKRVRFAYGISEDLVRYRVTRSSLSRDKKKALGIVWSIYRNVELLSFTRSSSLIVGYALRGLAKQIGVLLTFRRI